MSETITIPGLPEGVTVVRFGYALSDEFVIAEGEIRRVGAKQGMSIKGLVVKPSQGYRFVFQAGRGSFAAEKESGDPISVTLHLQTHNEAARAALTSDLKRFIASLPGVTFNPDPDLSCQKNLTVHVLGGAPTT